MTWARRPDGTGPMRARYEVAIGATGPWASAGAGGAESDDQSGHGQRAEVPRPRLPGPGTPSAEITDTHRRWLTLRRIPPRPTRTATARTGWPSSSRWCWR